ncbi:hypothetical protein ACPPVT_07295 [Angustibacter sp. McL0619]|uniref:hypothetical protein n=1 Tax=Angustibacter sp. McL0619 TaxID=3415676 RepID=UPI003CF7020C
MPTVVVLLLCMSIGIVLGLKHKKLNAGAFVLCTAFGLLLGGTPIGHSANQAITSAGTAVVQGVAGVLR